MDMGFEYLWGDSDFNVHLFRAAAGSGEQAGVIGLTNLKCVAVSRGEREDDFTRQAASAGLRMAAREVPEITVQEDGSLLVRHPVN